MENQIWSFGKGLFKAYTGDSKIKNKLHGWVNCKLSCHYSYPDGKVAWDFIFPGKLYSRVAKALNLPDREKNSNRVKAGRKNGKKTVWQKGQYQEFGQF